MQKTVKVSLDSDILFTWGIYIECCGKPNYMSVHSIENDDFYSCEECDKPLAVMGKNGKMYYVGKELLATKGGE